MEHFTTPIHTYCMWSVYLEGTMFFFLFRLKASEDNETGGLRMEGRQRAGTGNESNGRELKLWILKEDKQVWG